MDHNEKYFRRAVQHHVRKSQHHAAMAAAIRKSSHMLKAAKGDLEELDVEALGELLQTFLDQHEAMGDEHGEMAEECGKCAKAASEAEVERAEKAAQARLTKRDGADALVPTAVRGNAIPPPPGVTMIPRTGQKAPEVPVVDPQFAKLVAIDNDEAPVS